MPVCKIKAQCDSGANVHVFNDITVFLFYIRKLTMVENVDGQTIWSQS